MQKSLTEVDERILQIGKTICLREVPNVRKVYDWYHPKGFEILSVSLDEKKENWMEAIDKHNLNWEHVSSLKG